MFNTGMILTFTLLLGPILNICFALPFDEFARGFLGSLHGSGVEGIRGRDVLETRQASAFGVRGISSGKGQDGSVPLRLEIRDLQKNADQWNLYLLGLAQMQAADQSDKLSWYQIAGIHGRPFMAWDNVQAASGSSSTGYCTHSSVLFPTWHRPYLALYEQALYSNIEQIVSQFQGPDHDRYAKALQTLRIPYWDWAKDPPQGQSTLPDSIGNPATVQVHSPKGSTTMPNPLYTYTFHPLNNKDLPDKPFSTWNTTMRYPTNQNADAKSQDNLVGKQLDNSRQSFKARLYNLLTAYPNYSNFSNKAWIPNDGGNYDSVESLHDQIHGLTGNGGHMAIIDYSAFDPIFFLHHTMVDRVFAIWQALYPGSYVNPEQTQYGTFTNPRGSTEDVNTNLTPFHSSNDSAAFWTSSTIRNPKAFGYTYPELVDWNVTNAQYMSSVRTAVNQLYGNKSPANSKAQRRRRSLPAKQETTKSVQPRENLLNLSLNDIFNKVINEKKYHEYIANIRVDRFALHSSFFIHFFLGDFDENDPSKWSLEKNLVGTHCVFVNGNKAHDDSMAEQQVTGTIPLTSALLDAVGLGLLENLENWLVTQYIKNNLRWRISTMDDKSVPNSQVPGLTVSIVSSQVTQASKESEFPSWGSFIFHNNATEGDDSSGNSGDSGSQGGLLGKLGL